MHKFNKDRFREIRLSITNLEKKQKAQEVVQKETRDYARASASDKKESELRMSDDKILGLK